jgi:hypothetical protein
MSNNNDIYPCTIEITNNEYHSGSKSLFIVASLCREYSERKNKKTNSSQNWHISEITGSILDIQN